MNRLTKGRALVGKIDAGDLAVGGGSTVSKISSGTATVTWTNLATTTTASASFTLTGAATGDVVSLNAGAISSTAVGISHWGVTGADTVTVWAQNNGAASVASASATVTYLWFDM